MTTRHLVDPELVAALDMSPALELTTEAVVQTRATHGMRNELLKS